MVMQMIGGRTNAFNEAVDSITEIGKNKKQCSHRCHSAVAIATTELRLMNQQATHKIEST